VSRAALQREKYLKGSDPFSQSPQKRVTLELRGCHLINKLTVAKKFPSTAGWIHEMIHSHKKYK
jgi:hypothetical protein